MMKKRYLLLGMVSVVLLAVAWQFRPTAAPLYSQRAKKQVHTDRQTARGMLEYLHLMRGEYTHEDYVRLVQAVKAMPVDRSSLSWVEQGPDNIGGRTRAILVDKNDINHIYAGSVSGGLFESFNRANFWTPVTEFYENLSISSMCQTADGTIYVATGHNEEEIGGTKESGGRGGGVYVKNADGSFSTVQGTANYRWVNEVVCDTVNNVVWMATQSGLQRYEPATGEAPTQVTEGISASFAITALDISPDGEVIVCCANGQRTYVSTDGGVTFVNYSSSLNTDNPIPQSKNTRIEYAISDVKDEKGNYHIYASGSKGRGFLNGVWMSEDNGVNWERIAPENNDIPGSFNPFRRQGNYNNVVIADHKNPEKVFLGGIDLYSWSTTENWTQRSLWSLDPTNKLYVHADNHDLVWDKTGRLYVGNDGGVQISDDGGKTFFPANRGYNVTQFFAIGTSAYGDVAGGTQDNGTLTNYRNNATRNEFKQVYGGDGFSAAISFINPDIVFSTVYYSSLRRASDGGAGGSESATQFVPSELTGGTLCEFGNPYSNRPCGSFFTHMSLWENPNDIHSEDSIFFVPSRDYAAGEIAAVESQTTGMTIAYTIPFDIEFQDTVLYNSALTELDTLVSSGDSLSYNLALVDYAFLSEARNHPIASGDSLLINGTDTLLVTDYRTINHYFATNEKRPSVRLDMGNDSMQFAVSWDTLRVQDPYQSWLVLGLGNDQGVWMTRNALRFSAPVDEWFNVADTSALGEVTALEFSRNGNTLFIGTADGQLWRLSGFGRVYSPTKADVPKGIVGDTLINWSSGHYATELARIGSGFGNAVTDIAVEDDPNHVVVTVGGFSTNAKVNETNNATGSLPTWTNISGNLPNELPVYTAVIDRQDPNLILIGTEVGVFVTTDGGKNWANSSGDFGNVPVFDIIQNWRSYDEGSRRPGEIYIGTHGRGIWSTADYLSLPSEQEGAQSSSSSASISIYPNPLNDAGNVAFTLQNSSRATVQLFNLNGQLVRTTSYDYLPEGETVLQFGAADLPRGTYLIRVHTDEWTKVSKLIKQ